MMITTIMKSNGETTTEINAGNEFTMERGYINLFIFGEKPRGDGSDEMPVKIMSERTFTNRL